jgi:aromatic-L-amino-acid decarboxylase
VSLDLSREGLQRAANRAADIFTQIYADLEQRRVDPAASRETLKLLFADTIGERGIGLDQVLDEFERQVLPHSMGTAHPMYLGLVNSSPLPAGPLADLLVSSLNNNGGAFHQSPAITTLESEVIAEFSRLCGFDDRATGMIVPGGTYANLQGLLLARHAHFPLWNEDGPESLSGRPMIYCSDVTHFCVNRAATAIGVGRRGVGQIPTKGRGVMDVVELDAQIERDRQAGCQPFAVIANAGTTGTGAIDDINAIADVCQKHELWLHVDACYGGGALLLDPRPQELGGIARADSIAIDPHKWFFIPMTAGLLLTRHAELQQSAFDVDISYIPGDGEVDAFRRGIPTSRRSTGLTIWMVLRAHGWSVLREAVTRNVQLTRELEKRLGDSGFRVLHSGQLSVACARWEPTDFAADSLDELQTNIAQSVIASGRAWFSTVRFEQQIWLRLNLLNIHTQSHHIAELAQLMVDTAEQCTRR